MIKTLKINILSLGIIIISLLFIPSKGVSQVTNSTVDSLVNAGFENVCSTETDTERIYVIQNSAYKLQGVGIGKALDIIMLSGMPVNKRCRVIVLNNNIPQISLICSKKIMAEDSTSLITRSDWDVTYDLGNSWEHVKGITKKNSSLYKVDIVVYPELLFRNYILSKMYEFVFNLSPAVEVSLWKGMKLTAQVVIPIHNDYGENFNQVRPGYLSVSQTFRLPYKTFVTATVGNFNNFRMGFDLRAKHFFNNERFFVGARLGYTWRGMFDKWSYYHGKKWTLIGDIEGGYFWPKYNTQFTLRVERFLLEEYGLRAELVRHFRYASIGFYMMKVQHMDLIANKGFNGGFMFQIALPPYRYKRRGYVPRVTTGEFGIRYNAGNEKQYGNTYRSLPDDHYMTENEFNPYFIKSEILKKY